MGDEPARHEAVKTIGDRGEVTGVAGEARDDHLGNTAGGNVGLTDMQNERGIDLNQDESEEDIIHDQEVEDDGVGERVEGRRRVKIGIWNVEGLFEKLGLNGVSEYINSLDVACLGETFTLSSFDFNIKFGDFTVLHNPAKKFNIRGRPSGGLVLLIRKTLERFITIIDTKINHVLCFKIGKDCLNTDKDIVCIGTYVHPADSVFYTDEDHDCTLEAVEQFMLDQLEEGEEFEYLLMGDLNARIGDWGLKVGNIEEDEDEETEVLERVTQDGVINENGHKLIQICIAFNATPINGLKNKGFGGNYTFIGRRGNSTIDHYICSANLLDRVENYRVGDRVESQHLPVELDLCESGAGNNNTEEGQIEEREIRIAKWKESKREESKNILNKPGIRRDLLLATELLDEGIAEGLDKFDSVMKKINKPMVNTIKVGREREDKKKWFDKDCEIKKKEARKALIAMAKIDAKAKKEEHKRAKDLYLDKRIEYQKLIRSKRKTYKKEMQNKLIESRHDAKSFWGEIRKISFRKTRLANITIGQWGEHFEKVFNPDNEGEEEVNDHNRGDMGQEREERRVELEIEGNIEGVEELDEEISREEVGRGIDNLKQGKTGGLDEISAELLQMSKESIVEFLYKLFNILFNTSTFPLRWAVAIVVPLYKKGEVNNPDNYRGISLLSVTSKIFTGILNKRLYNWAEENEKINVEQAGFRRSHSTIDHIYTLHSIISNCLYGRKRSKMYVCFVDFKKAFDTVNRTTLWGVLERQGVTNKMLSIIRALYNRVTAVVRYGSELTGEIECPMGVRQGCLLSPLLFTLLVTELAQGIAREGRHGYQFNPGMIELFTLLFADDIALLATTPMGLQTQIDNLKRGAERLGLVVNLEKTKVMVFRKGGFLGRLEKWYYGEERIEVVNKYKYLGYTLTTKLSVDIALAEHAGKAKGKIVSIFRALYRLGKIDLGVFFKLFDSQVKPMLLYGAEIWGMKKRDIIEKVHLFACKKLLGVSAKTPNSFIYYELNRYPLFIDARMRVIKYWTKLLGMEEGRLPKQAYMREMRELDKENGWGLMLQENLIISGYGNVWQDQDGNLVKTITKGYKQRQIDIFWQEEHRDMEESRSRRFVKYLSFKEEHSREGYLGDIRIPKFRRALTRFRFGVTEIRANKRFTNPQAIRRCPFCIFDEDEEHFLLLCPAYKQLRDKYIARHWITLNNITLKDLLANENVNITRGVAAYIYYAMLQRDRR